MSTVEQVLDETTQRDSAASANSDGSRREDTEIITGERKFAADHSPQGLLHAAVFRSPHAHARITKIDTSAAARLDGVIGAFSAEDLPEYVGSPSSSYPPDTAVGSPYQDSTPDENPVIR